VTQLALSLAPVPPGDLDPPLPDLVLCISLCAPQKCSEEREHLAVRAGYNDVSPITLETRTALIHKTLVLADGYWKRVAEALGMNSPQAAYYWGQKLGLIETAKALRAAARERDRARREEEARAARAAAISARRTQAAARKEARVAARALGRVTIRGRKVTSPLFYRTTPQTDGWAVAYLAGVLAGDGSLGVSGFALGVSDKDFAEAFAFALGAAFDIPKTPRQRKSGYWEVRVCNGYGRFDFLRSYSAREPESMRAWLRGFFDSEGNASCLPNRRFPNCTHKRVSMYSTNHETLDRAAAYLGMLGIPSTVLGMRSSAGHLGSKQVYCLRVRSSRENYHRFLSLIGSSIERKRAAMLAIVESYCADLPAALRAAQQRGVASRRRNRTLREQARA